MALELLDLVFISLGFWVVVYILDVWKALWRRVKDAISERLAALPATLAAMLREEIAKWDDLLTLALDFVTYHWHRNGLYIGLACGFWLLLTLHRRTRFWALLPFRYIWHTFLFLHFSLWSLSVRCPVDKELDHLPDSVLGFLFPREIEIPEDSAAHIDEGPAEDSEATEPEPPKKVYKGPLVKSLRSKNGLVNSAPIMRSN